MPPSKAMVSEMAILEKLVNLYNKKTKQTIGCEYVPE